MYDTLWFFIFLLNRYSIVSDEIWFSGKHQQCVGACVCVRVVCDGVHFHMLLLLYTQHSRSHLFLYRSHTSLAHYIPMGWTKYKQKRRDDQRLCSRLFVRSLARSFVLPINLKVHKKHPGNTNSQSTRHALKGGGARYWLQLRHNRTKRRLQDCYHYNRSCCSRRMVHKDWCNNVYLHPYICNLSRTVYGSVCVCVCLRMCIIQLCCWLHLEIWNVVLCHVF